MVCLPHICLISKVPIDGLRSASQQRQASPVTAFFYQHLIGQDVCRSSCVHLLLAQGLDTCVPNAGGARTPRPSMGQEKLPGVARVPARTAARQAAAADPVGAQVPLAAAAAALAHPAVVLGDEPKVLTNACCCVSIARNNLLTVSQNTVVLSCSSPLHKLPKSRQLLYSNRLSVTPHQVLSEDSKSKKSSIHGTHRVQSPTLVLERRASLDVQPRAGTNLYVCC